MLWKIIKFLSIDFVICLFFTSCGLTMMYSDDISGKWQACDNSNGVRVCIEYVFSEIKETETTEKQPDAISGEMVDVVFKKKTGTYSYNFYEDEILLDDFSTKGKFEIDTKTYAITLIPDDELAEVKTFSYMLINKYKSLELIEMVQESVGQGLMFTKQLEVK